MATSNPYEPPGGDKTTQRDSPVVPVTSQASWFAVFAPFFVQTMMTCACGHLHLYILPITIMILLFAVRDYADPGSKTSVALLGLAISTVFFGKHLVDILWLGHDPFLSF